MAALSAMVTLEIPQVNIMTKMDLLSPKAKKEIEKYVLHKTKYTSWTVLDVCMFYLQISGPRHVLRDGGQLCRFAKQEI